MITSIRTAVTATFLLLTSLVDAQTAPPEIATPSPAQPVTVEVFQAPQMKEIKPPPYPNSERARGRDGWVNLNFMIDPQGKPYEIMVTDSSGNEVFEKAAMRGAESWKFEPATFAGVPVDAGFSLKVNFVLTDNAGASSEFISAYRQFHRALKAEDRAQADVGMGKMKVQNLYEDAYFNLAQYEYARRWGTRSQQLQAIKRAIAEERNAGFLPKEAFLASLQILLNLQVKQNDFAGALQTWGKLQGLADAATLTQWENTIGQVRAMRTGDRPYAVSGDFQGSSSWNFLLYRNKFQLAVSAGRVAEIKLRCDKGYVFFRYDPDVQYTVAEKSGACAMELVGDPGTQFQLIQS